VDALGIAGSGAIACGLAAAADESFAVTVWARSERSAAAARARLTGTVRVVTELEELAACPIVVEAIAEDTDAKSQLHASLLNVIEHEAILATTTSSLSVAGLAAASGHPERFAALHVFNPVERMPLVEVAFPELASARTRRAIHVLCERLGKTAIEVPDRPGFIVNRLLFPFLFDAVRLLEWNGLDPGSVDNCVKLGLGHPMGPLALLDFVGLDVAAAIGAAIGADVPQRVRHLVAVGRLGRKTGAGFYDYLSDGTRRSVPTPARSTGVAGQGA
jgi:3-hydroxybutyryl-CoA dehydrogenase